MSIAAGVVLLTTATATALWAGAGDRLAQVPAVARVVEYLDGGYNLPSESAVDRLEHERNLIRDRGGHDGDDLVSGPYAITFGEALDAAWSPDLFTTKQIDDAPNGDDAEMVRELLPPSIFARVREYLRGGYAMPSDKEIDDAPPHTVRGQCKADIAAHEYFCDESSSATRKPNPTGLS